MRSRHPSSLVLASAVLLFVAGCSPRSDRAGEAAEGASEAGQVAQDAAAPASKAVQTSDRASQSAGSAIAPPFARPEPAAEAASADAEVPGIGPDAAPGVAFAYRYAFTLPANAIAGVQQQHAAACERLGPTRCEVTGMSYDQPREGEVSARLDLMLAPEVAHSFSGDAVAAVEKADGSLDKASIAGDDAGGEIDRSLQRSDALRAQLSRIERRLTTPGLSDEEKTQLAQRAADLRQQLGGEQQVRQDKEAALAMTPMTFNYGTQGMFSSSNPFGQAASNSMGSMQAMLAFLLTAAGLLLPWLLLGALVVLLIRFRAMKQRLAQATGGAVDSAPPQ